MESEQRMLVRIVIPLLCVCLLGGVALICAVLSAYREPRDADSLEGISIAMARPQNTDHAIIVLSRAGIRGSKGYHGYVLEVPDGSQYRAFHLLKYHATAHKCMWLVEPKADTVWERFRLRLGM